MFRKLTLAAAFILAAAPTFAAVGASGHAIT